MDIVLNTTFDNEYLPTAVFPGFVDTFSEADGDVLLTEDLKDWEHVSSYSSGSILERISGNAAHKSGTPSGIHYVDALSADGVLSATFPTIGGRNMPLVWRYVDASNYFTLLQNNSGTLYRITRYVAGVATVALATSTASANGDEVAVTLDGNTTYLRVNGTLLGSYTDSTFNTATLHGVASSASDTTIRMGSISFVAPGGAVE